MRAFKQYLLSLLILTALTSSYVFLRYAHDYPFPIGPQFDPHIRPSYKKMLEKEQPQLLVLGDSAVETNLNADMLADRLGKRVSAISEPGAGSALLYLILKNNIATAKSKPDILILLFPDTLLTTPNFRVFGTFFKRMDEYAGAQDDDVLEVAIRDQMNPLEKLAEAYFPPYWGRWDLRALLLARVINFPTSILFDCTVDCTERAMGEVFGNENFEPGQLNAVIGTANNFLYTKENLNFEHQVNRSFLPGIIRICRENGIKLVLVRIKMLRFSMENPEPPALIKYINDLRLYTQNQDVILIDFAHDERLSADLFRDTQHLNPNGKKIFTDMLIEALRSSVEIP